MGQQKKDQIKDQILADEIEGCYRAAYKAGDCMGMVGWSLTEKDEEWIEFELGYKPTRAEWKRALHCRAIDNA